MRGQKSTFLPASVFVPQFGFLRELHSQGDASENYDDDCTAREAVLVCGYSYSGVDISFVYGGAALQQPLAILMQ